MNTIIYDIEIDRAIPQRGQLPVPGIRYCEGWHDHAGMGVAVAGVYDYAEGRYRVFCRDNWAEFEALWNSSGLVVGFNQIGFDNKVLDAMTPVAERRISTRPQYDILQELWAAHGLSRTFSPRTHGGFGLDPTAKVNFGGEKTGDGAQAPINWQQGRIASVIDYCLEDVRLTKLLFDRILATGRLLSPKHGGSVTLNRPALPSGIDTGGAEGV